MRKKQSTSLKWTGALMLGVFVVGTGSAQELRPESSHAVFVMTNDANANQVLAFERYGNGALREPRSYQTGGRGSGGTVDPLTSQGSLTLSDDGKWLFAVNAGSGTLSLFRVKGARLALTDEEPTGGSEPNAVAQHGSLVYVLNAAGSSSVVGFRLEEGRLQPIDQSLRFLSGNNIGSASIAFSPDGRFLIVTERSTNSIDVFKVLADGKLSPLKINPGAAPGVFAAIFAPSGRVIVSETGPGAPNASTVSSYAVQSDLQLAPITVGLPTLGTANCWNVVTPDGRFAYVSNSGSASIAGFALGDAGELTPLPGTVVANNPAGSINLDIAISADGAFLYSLNSGSGSISVFAIDARTGALTSFGAVGGLPVNVGFNGIAAN